MTDEQSIAESYYDEHAVGKLAGYVNVNRRVEMAWQTVLNWAPPAPTRILEIGCGIGDISHRMSLVWSQAEVTGLDISPRSIEIGTRLFGSDRVSYRCDYLTENTFSCKFDLVVMMDMYEHLASRFRPAFHASIASLLAPGARVILSFPSVRHQEWVRQYEQEGVQPVEEDIDIFTITGFASDLQTGVLYYSEVDVWNEGDYVHAVLGRRPPRVPAAPSSQNGGLKSQVSGLLGTRSIALKRARRQLEDYAEGVRPHSARWQSTRLERLRRVRERLGDTFGLD